MLIINDIDIIQTDANKIEYHSADAEKKQSFNSRTTPYVISALLTTNKTVDSSKHSFPTDYYTNLSPIQSTVTHIANETLIPISQINPYINK
jgi:hypothetical protein